MLGLRAFLCAVFRCSHCLPLKLYSGCRLKAACSGVLQVPWPSADLLCNNTLRPNPAERSNTFLAIEEGGCKRESNERYGESQRSVEVYLYLFIQEYINCMYMLMKGIFIPQVVIKIYIQLQQTRNDVQLMLHVSLVSVGADWKRREKNGLHYITWIQHIKDKLCCEMILFFDCLPKWYIVFLQSRHGSQS